MVKKNTCIFISGQGSNLKSLIARSRDSSFPIKISLVISNNKEAFGLNYAKKFKIPYILINTKLKNYENKVFYYLKKYKISFICLAGYMKIISNSIINNYQGKIINIHPSLLPKFKGLNTFSRMLKNKEKNAGCTVHYVNNKLDSGNMIIQKRFSINRNDDEKILKKKTQKLEYLAFSEAIVKIFRNN
tara:strand:+ start:3386 stop:3949 length:564 start_codon:yes stop_codon:yes gene_type:complete